MNNFLDKPFVGGEISPPTKDKQKAEKKDPSKKDKQKAEKK